MTDFVATPALAVAVPRPVTVPAPPVFAKVTTVVLSLVSVLPLASLRVAVSVWVSPAVVEPLSVRTICGACAVDDREAERACGESAAVGVERRSRRRAAPVTVLVATPATAVSVPRPVTVPAPECLGEGDDAACCRR